MVGFVFAGALAGILLAYLCNVRKRHFRVRLLEEYESSKKADRGVEYVAGIVRRREQWKRSLSLVRKPFGKQVNVAIETAALIYAAVGLINTFTDFDKHYSTASQGAAALVLIGFIIAFIPSEWIMTGSIEKQMDAVLDDLGEALEGGRVEPYLAQARETWR